jgi:beta-glucosidase
MVAIALLAGCSPNMPVQSSGAVMPAPARAAQDPSEQRFVDSVLKLMSVDEKLGQLNQLSGVGDPTGPGGTAAGIDRIRRGEIGSLFNITGADTIAKLQHIAVEQSRLHIPIVFGLDVIHGYRTIFPVPLAEASSWDPSAAERSARVAATEAAAAGIAWTFAPMVDVARDPRWGRIVEGSGEDPVLGAAMAMARVRGFQGSDLRAHNTIAATAKHFAAYGAAEGGRDYNIANIPERTLREVYLPPFHAAVCANTATLMASFNEIDGTPSHANRHLLTDILRREWSSDAMVVSDWTGVAELLNHGVGATRADVGALALDAGVDMDMVAEIYQRDLPALVRSGRISMSTLDEAVRRVLTLKYRLGLFADPYGRSDPQRERSAILTPENRAAARDVARRSIVLLKNDRSILPLRKDLDTIAVIGALAADSAATLGNWAALGRHVDAIPPLDGIRRAVTSRTAVLYARGANVEGSDTSGFAEALRTARRASAVVLVIGETPDMSAEANSRAFLDIPGVQERLANALAAIGKPLVVVLMNGRPLAIQHLSETVPVIVESWFLGVETGNALADVLFGDFNPGGKLPATFPRAIGQVPIYYAHKNTGRPPVATEHYTSKYNDLPWTPLYPFGYGLSYTTFTTSAPRLDATSLRAGDSLGVSFDVRNTGTRAGDEVVQLYIRDDVASVTRPVMELRRFRRVTLQPGESRALRFTLGMRDLAFLDTSMTRVVEPGTFTVFAGTSSTDVQQARFTLTTAGAARVPVPDDCARWREQ